MIALVGLVLFGSGNAALAAPNPSVTVADAALSQSRATLLRSWPDTPAAGMPFNAALIRAQLSPLLYPDPAPGLGPFASAVAYDNLMPALPDVTWDMNGDDRMIVDYRGASGNLVCRIQVMVERHLARAPHGVVLYAGGNVVTGGAGNNPRIRIDVPPWSGNVTAFVGGYVDTPAVFETGIVVLTGEAVPSLEEVMQAGWVPELTGLAMASGRYFTSFADALASPPSALAPQGGLSGLCVVRPPEASVLQMPSMQVNTQSQPGCLVVLGDSCLTFSGLCRYYGVVYTEGMVRAWHGTPEIEGMLVTTGDVDDRGAMNLYYNDDCVDYAVWPTSVNALPGTDHWLDTTAPVSAQTGADGGWHAAPATVSFSAEDEFGGSGVATVEYRLDGGDWTTGDAVSIWAEGRHDFAYRAVDHAGNVEPAHTATVLVDGTLPVTEAAGIDEDWHTGPVAVTLSATDTGSGVARMEYSLDGGATWTAGASVLISAEGRNEISYRAVDVAGNVEPAHHAQVLIDAQPPTTRDDVDNHWHNGDATVRLDPTDATSGVAATYFTVDGGPEQTGTRVLVQACADHSNDGVHTVRYWSVDGAGNVEAATAIPVAIDTLAPSSSSDAPSGWVTQGPVVVHFTGDDGLGSGVAFLQSSMDGGQTWQTGEARTVSEDGSTALLSRAVDVASNVGACSETVVRIDTKAPTSLLSGVKNDGWYGHDVAVTLAAADPAGGSGFSHFSLTVDGEPRLGMGTPHQVTIAAPSDHSRDGRHSVGFSAVDAAGNAEARRSVVVNVDTRQPQTKAPAACTVRRNHTARVRFEVVEEGPTSGRADVTIRIRTEAGKLVKRVILPGIGTNVLRTARFRCTLRRGSYRFEVSATDGAGNRERRAASNRLIVF